MVSCSIPVRRVKWGMGNVRASAMHLEADAEIILTLKEVYEQASFHPAVNGILRHRRKRGIPGSGPDRTGSAFGPTGIRQQQQRPQSAYRLARQAQSHGARLPGSHQHLFTRSCTAPPRGPTHRAGDAELEAGQPVRTDPGSLSERYFSGTGPGRVQTAHAVSAWVAPSEKGLQLRVLARHIDSLVAQQTRELNRLHALEGSRTAPRSKRNDCRRCRVGRALPAADGDTRHRRD